MILLGFSSRVEGYNMAETAKVLCLFKGKSTAHYETAKVLWAFNSTKWGPR